MKKAIVFALLLLAAHGAFAEADVHAGTQEISGAAPVDLSGGVMPAGVERNGNTVTVTAAGVYRVTGELDGRLVVDAGGKDEVTLALDGARIVNETGAAIYVENAGLTTLLLPEGSASLVRSGSPAALDGSAVDENAGGGAIHAKDDLRIEGEGALFVGGYLNNGVHTSNRLSIAGGALTVEAVHDGLKGKDAVTVSGGSVQITCGGDGIDADSEDGEGYGVATVSGGDVRIVSAQDGVQAETLLEVTGGTIDVNAGGGSENAPAHEQAGFGGHGGPGGLGGGRGAGRGARPFGDAQGLPETPDGAAEGPGKGMPGGAGMTPDGTAPEDAPEGPEDRAEPSEAMSQPTEAALAPVAEEDEAEPDGAKGLKSGGVLRITGGEIAVDAQDDALHSDGSVEVSGGALTLASGDDGMHADERLTIAGGEVNVTASYEGIEANQIAIDGGDVRVRATDDGLNANGGAQVSWGRRAVPQGEDGEMPNLLVTGGTLQVDAQGDGLDSNGNICVSGGLVVVDGPSASGNGALDSGAESGGTLLVNGGTVLAVGASGMSETFDEASGQASLMVNLEQTAPAGSEVQVSAQDGTALYTHTAAKAFSSVIFSSPELRQGETVTVTAGEQQKEVLLEGMSTSAGAEGRGFFRR